MRARDIIGAQCLVYASPSSSPAHWSTPTRNLDADRVQHYIEQPDQALVVVFETSEGLLLADGYHRLAAARRRGEETVAVELRKGSRRDALRYAAVTGATQRGLSVEQALGHIANRSGGRWDEGC